MGSPTLRRVRGGTVAKPTPESEIASLRAEIEGHNRLYYVDAAPRISDRDYDRLMERLQALEVEHPELVTPDSPTRKVGGQPLDEFATVNHAVPMLSIENTYNFAEVREWDARVRKGLNPGDEIRYAVELKVDGVAVGLRYEAGKLVLGATRGDGFQGDDITANIRTVRGVPKALGADPPAILEVRGEVYMTNAELIRLNELRAAAEEPPFANPRNSTAGSLKLLDSQLCASRRLRFVAHGLGQTEGIEAGSYSEILAFLKSWGIPISPHNARYATIDEVIEHAERWQTLRNNLDFQTDGLVVKVDDLRQRERLGLRSKSPRWVIAYKYAAEQAVTKVVGIGVQVGKTGKLTPVADLAPVALAGTTVRRASLHNADEIARKGRPGRRHRRHPEGRRDHPPGCPGRVRGARRDGDPLRLPHDLPELRGSRRARSRRRRLPLHQSPGHFAPSSSRSRSAGSPIATRWTWTGWGKS